jgi:hypothetical protein
VRLPRQRIWPILPGVRSFLNCVGDGVLERGGCRVVGLGWWMYLCGNVLGASSLARGLLYSFLHPSMMLTIARSGMKRSPRTNTNREVMVMCVVGVLLYEV